MNLDNIVVGQRVQNYRKLCELMEENVYGGTQKAAQLKRWKQFFSWEKMGNAYVIKEIYEVPKENQDGRQKYLAYMEPLILSHLCLNDGYFEGSVKNICQGIGAVRSCVYNEDEYRDWLPPVEHFDALEVRRAQLAIKDVAKRILMSTLDSLKKRQILTWEKKYYVKPEGAAVRIATGEEVRTIKNIDEATRRELDATPFKLSVNPSLNTKYNNALKIAYQKEGWLYVFTHIEVVGVDQEIIGRYAEVDSQEQERAVRRVICHTAQKEIRNNCERDERKAEEQGGWPEGFSLGRMRAESICYLIDEFTKVD